MATGIEESKTDTITTSGTGAMLLSSEQPDTKVPVPKLERISKGTDIDTKDDEKSPEKLTNGAVDKITTYLKDLNKTSSNQNANTSTAVERFKSVFAKKFEEVKGEVDAEKDAKLKQEKEDAFYDKCNNVIDLSQSILDNLDDLTGDDPLKCITSTLDVIGTAAELFGGPVQGVIVSTVCGIVSSIISIFGGDDTKDGQSLSEVLGAVVKEALNEFKDESINEDFQGAILEGKMTISVLNGIASYNGGKLGHESEETILTSLDYARVGLPLMGELQYQVSKYYADNNDTQKQGYLPKYLYYYCVIFQMKTILLSLQSNLLRANGLDSAFAGISRYLNVGMPKAGREFLSFLEELPKLKPDRPFWYVFYRNIHDPTILNQGQRKIIAKTLDACKVKMAGQLVKLTNDSVGDACILKPLSKKNSRIVPGSLYYACSDVQKEHYNSTLFDHEFTQDEFGPLCNLFRIFSPQEPIFTSLNLPPEFNGFILFSVKYSFFVFMTVNPDFNFALYGFNEREKLDMLGMKDIYSMVFKLDDNILIGGNETRNWTEEKEWKYTHCWVKKKKWHRDLSSYQVTKGVYKAQFRGTEDMGDDDTFRWNLLKLDYGEYVYSQDDPYITPSDLHTDFKNSININIGKDHV